jgi:Bacterial alpha-L-rhamnosidase C-terminal domain
VVEGVALSRLGHPAYNLLTLVAGIEPASPGFASVRIAPHLGDLREASAGFPHAQGMFRVHFERAGDALTGRVTLPPGASSCGRGNSRRCAPASTRLWTVIHYCSITFVVTVFNYFILDQLKMRFCLFRILAAVEKQNRMVRSSSPLVKASPEQRLVANIALSPR